MNINLTRFLFTFMALADPATVRKGAAFPDFPRSRRMASVPARGDGQTDVEAIALGIEFDAGSQ